MSSHERSDAAEPGGNAAADATLIAQLQDEVQRSTEQLAATSEVLRVISASPGELEPVFQAMLENAVRICDARFGLLQRFDGEMFYPAAMHRLPKEFADFLIERGAFQPVGTPLEKMWRTKQTIHSLDLTKDPVPPPAATYAGARSYLAVPMLKDDELVGAIGIWRQEVQPFTDKQIALVQNFAAQAVIAIENTRLLNELRQRTADLSESLEQQAATSEVLRVISASPSDVAPVFQAMLQNAVRLCGASFGNIYRWDGDALHLVSAHNTPPAFVAARSPTWRPSPDSSMARTIATKTLTNVVDLAAERRYTERSTSTAEAFEIAGARSYMAVPILKESELIGVIGIFRQEVRPFTDKQIALVQNFAAQAVIAIENTRLLNELRQRTADLTESLEQQTATADVLRVISSSPGELEPVFQAMLENATRMCDAKFGTLMRFDGSTFHYAALVGAPPELAEFHRQRGPFKPPMGSTLDRLLRTKDVVRVADASAEPVPPPSARLAGSKSYITVPMFKGEELVGAITVYRQEVRPFTDKQTALLQNFAAQAVIAIENTRLLKELRERTDQLEAQSQEVVKLNQQLEQRVAAQVGEIERMGRLRRFLPPQVADLIVASGGERQLESHRREIAALFCDLRGFTGFSESSDPEDVMALLREYHAAIGEIIIKYSGTLERFAGDGVMVVFNNPVPMDNPALQAVRMALDMRAAIGALIERWRRLGHDLGFGIGISHGFATLGTIGFEGRFDYAAIGTVSNVASRLCDEAKPGQILISPRVLMAVEQAVTVEPAGDFTLKGIRRPMTVYNVLAAVAAKS